MKGRRGLIIALGAATAVAVGGAGLGVWHSQDRVGMVSTLCKIGLPNLSRPAEVDAERLGCAVLGPRTRLTGFVTSDFEDTTLFVGELVIVRANGTIRNPSAWFSGSEGLDGRGWRLLQRELEPRRPGLCGGRLAKATAEGWMTVSPGEFGHLGRADRQFFAYRIISASPPSSEELRQFALIQPGVQIAPGFAEHCLRREQSRDDGY